ncbi:MAG: LacI family DNA-binding transcriptional regulator [Caldilineaceae bacterium]
MATIRDVAAKAGVNPSTVSRVFSGKAKISSRTQQRVLQAAAELEFQPNAIAQSLSARRTHTIAIVVPHIYDGYFDDSFFPQIMRGLLQATYARKFRILVGGSNSHADVITQTFQILGSRQADGIVVVSNRLDVDTVGALVAQGAPFVLVGKPPSHYTAISWVDADNEVETARVVTYLIRQGHRRIAFVGGDPDVAVTSERLCGYHQAMAAANLLTCAEWINYGFFAEVGGYKAAERMVALGENAPTAYYAANDLMAVGILSALRERAIAVPEQVSVIGTNDSAEATHVMPALTTLRVPYAEMAAMAANLLIDTILTADLQPPVQRFVKCQLIERHSSGRAPL